MSDNISQILYRRFVEEVVNGGDLDLIPELFSENYVDHSAPPGAPAGGGFDAIRAVPLMFRESFPDLHFEIEQMIGEGDWLATRVTGRATHLGRPFMGIDPTGLRATWSSYGFFRVANGRIVEHHGLPDLMSLRAQLSRPIEPGTLDENRAIVTRYVYEVNMANFDAFDELVDPDFIDHEPVPGQKPGVEGLKDAYRMFIAVFPDVWFTFEDLVAEGDLVVGRGTVRGTHQGSFMGEEPTGNKVTWTGTHTFRVKDAKVVEGWLNIDMLGLMQQVGIIPPTPSG